MYNLFLLNVSYFIFAKFIIYMYLILTQMQAENIKVTEENKK